MQNDHDVNSIPFDELKKRWAQQEETAIKHDKPHLDAVRSSAIQTSQSTPNATDPGLTRSSANLANVAPKSFTDTLPFRPHQQVGQSLSVPATPSESVRIDNFKRSTLVAEQINRNAGATATNGNFPPPPLPTHRDNLRESPFEQEAHQSLGSDSDLEYDGYSSGSGYSDIEEQVQQLEHTSLYDISQPVGPHAVDHAPGFNSNNLEPSAMSSALPPTSSREQMTARTPPPPPPPSSKYHSVARPKQSAPPEKSLPPDVEEHLDASGHSGPVLPPRRPTSHTTNLSGESYPQLPPRRSQSFLVRSNPTPTENRAQEPSSNAPYLTSPNNNLSRANTLNVAPTYSTGRQDNTTIAIMYPDMSSMGRDQPFLPGHKRLNDDEDRRGKEQRINASHRGSVHSIAVSGSYVATGSHQTCLWDIWSGSCVHAIDTASANDINDRVRSLAFAPARSSKEDGQLLWAGLQDGVILVLDTYSGDIVARRSTYHAHAILFILRQGNSRLWSLDESGALMIWNVLATNGEHEPPIKHRIQGKAAVAALLVGEHLWTSSGRTLDVERFMTRQESSHIRIPLELGNITCLATIPCHPTLVYSAHDNGIITSWNTRTLEQGPMFKVAMCGVTAMANVGDSHIWVGLNNGFIYVVDTRPDRWVVVKGWRAHKVAVTHIVVDESAFVQNNEASIKVFSADSNGIIHIWDGLMTDTWKDVQLQRLAQQYSTYQDLDVMICSWNINASKPEKIFRSDEDNTCEWLHGLPDPGIIVVGIQEIIDLESKKQTARSLFTTRKKNTAFQDAEEQLTHRYRLWHDYLVRMINKNYGQDTYTVIKTDQLVGLFSCVFVKSSVHKRVFDCDSTIVKTGLRVMNKSLHGNKGGIAIRLFLDNSSFCFVNCHLAAGQSHRQQRDMDADGILQSATFPTREVTGAFANGGDGSFITDHEHCFFSGDLNYRIDMTREQVLGLLRDGDRTRALAVLQSEDQLLKQRTTNPLHKLMMFKESPITFDPTYKYELGTDTYDQSEKKRIPAWCDRVLYRSRHIEPLYYERYNVRVSDHRPIGAGYRVKTKMINYGQCNKAKGKIDEEWNKKMAGLVYKKQAAYVAAYGMCSIEDATQRLAATQYNVEHVLADLFKSHYVSNHH